MADLSPQPDDRSATEVWQDWFDAKGRVWFGLGDCGSHRRCECVAALDCDDHTGERQAFLFRTFDPAGWFMVLDYNPVTTDDRTEVEWIQNCDGRLDGLVHLADFVASCVPSLRDTRCTGMVPDAALLRRLAERDIREATEVLAQLDAEEANDG